MPTLTQLTPEEEFWLRRLSGQLIEKPPPRVAYALMAKGLAMLCGLCMTVPLAVGGHSHDASVLRKFENGTEGDDADGSGLGGKP